MYIKRLITTFSLLLLSPLIFATDTGSARCEALRNLELKQAAIQSANELDNRCEVTVRVWPQQSNADSTFIDVTVWLPHPTMWNQRFLGLGNGGYSPRLPLEAMASQVAKGFAVGASDTGHQSESLDFVVNAQERIDFWGRSSVHVMREYSVKLIEAYYQREPEFNYFAGCSTGGHQALAAAQYYPADFDGIVAGAPGHNRVALNAAFLWLYQQSHQKNTGQPVLSRQDLRQYNQFLLNSCDTLDGSQDGVISEPLRCKPDYSALSCEGPEHTGCLTPDKIERIKRIHEGPVDPITGNQIYPGFPIGSEFTGQYGWSAYWADPNDQTQPARGDFWRYWVFEQTEWNPWEFDWHSDVQFAQHKLSHRIDAIKADLSAFFAQGHKLLMYHGMADPIVPYTDSVNYYKKVTDSSRWPDDSIASPIALYLIPGMSHCGGGDSLNYFDPLPSLQQWVEQQIRPQSIDAKEVKNGHILTVTPITEVSN
ncbi:MAG: tannase/feruloyl esterase family alpha/beta hydrolase [Alteromonadaceae bacterium]|nr:tannase/feruloyl esterase family alpha/beta hydrolase [Alteromonadaceae bacterium]